MVHAAPARPASGRETTLGRVVHPDPLPAAYGGPGVVRIDDPLAERIQKGDNVFGWEGDDRLALYICVPKREWQLWRLEADGCYRMAMRLSADAKPVSDVIPSLILNLVTHDQRRGYDARTAADQINAAVQKAVDNAAIDRLTNETFPKIRWAAEKDGLLDHVTGAHLPDTLDEGD
jgi:hypothetical protein